MKADNYNFKSFDPPQASRRFLSTGSEHRSTLKVVGFDGFRHSHNNRIRNLRDVWISCTWFDRPFCSLFYNDRWRDFNLDEICYLSLLLRCRFRDRATRTLHAGWWIFGLVHWLEFDAGIRFSAAAIAGGWTNYLVTCLNRFPCQSRNTCTTFLWLEYYGLIFKPTS